MHGRGVAKVVKARLATHAALAAQTGMDADLLERVFESADVHSLRVSPHKERSVGILRISRGTSPMSILGEDLNCLETEWNEPALEELRIANSQHGIGQIDVADRQ